MPEKSKLANKKTNTSTQQYLDIAEIRDDTVILKDGSLRSVLIVSSINFALKSEDEQNAIVQSYMSFLNSLEFPIQIVVQSRKLNIDKYMDNLSKKEKEQTNDLLRTQIAEYKDFIAQLVNLGDIMGKRFYVVVPYNPGKKSGKRGFFSRLGDVFSPGSVIKLSEKIFNKYHSSLASRVEKVSVSLEALGLSTAQLNTQSLIELYYNTYNSELSYYQKMPDREKIKLEKE